MNTGDTAVGLFWIQKFIRHYFERFSDAITMRMTHWKLHWWLTLMLCIRQSFNTRVWVGISDGCCTLEILIFKPVGVLHWLHNLCLVQNHILTFISSILNNVIELIKVKVLPTLKCKWRNYSKSEFREVLKGCKFEFEGLSKEINTHIWFMDLIALCSFTLLCMWKVAHLCVSWQNAYICFLCLCVWNFVFI